MVNKHVLRETFMKLESYDRVNVISDILRLSNTLELEFYSSVIENILKYHKLTVDNLREELNNDNNIKCFSDSDCTDSTVRSKLISTLSLLKSSNIDGALEIYRFLKRNYGKFKQEAHRDAGVYEEVLLIYQLANDHPAFSFDHCQQIYDYLGEIRKISVSRDYFSSNNDECISDLTVLSIEKNDSQQYLYRIKVKWDHFECCIIRTLEDVYHFYKKIYEMFPLEIKNREICHFYMSFIPDNLELSLTLMKNFFRDFLKSPSFVLRCDFVRQFFKPRTTDKNICKCDSCQINFNKLHWAGDRKFDPVTKCNSLNGNSDNDECNLSYDNKTDTPCSSNFNFSTNSQQTCDKNLPLEVIITNRIGFNDGSESSVKSKSKRIKTKKYHSTGSSPINTPSDESEVCSKNESHKNQIIECNRSLSIVIENTNMAPSTKDIRTENWISQSNSSENSSEILLKSPTETVDCNEDFLLDKEENFFDVSPLSHCEIGNLLEWLKYNRLHKYYSQLKTMNFGLFYKLTEENLNCLGFVEGASKKLVTLICRIKKSDIIVVDSNTINITLRERSTSTDSVTSVVSSSCGDYSSPNTNTAEVRLMPSFNYPPPTPMVQQYGYPIFVHGNYYLLPQNYIQNFMMIPQERNDQLNRDNRPRGQP